MLLATSHLVLSMYPPFQDIQPSIFFEHVFGKKTIMNITKL